jgi:hypothetical protein
LLLAACAWFVMRIGYGSGGLRTPISAAVEELLCELRRRHALRLPDVRGQLVECWVWLYVRGGFRVAQAQGACVTSVQRFAHATPAELVGTTAQQHAVRDLTEADWTEEMRLPEGRELSTQASSDHEAAANGVRTRRR